MITCTIPTTLKDRAPVSLMACQPANESDFGDPGYVQSANHSRRNSSHETSSGWNVPNTVRGAISMSNSVLYMPKLVDFFRAAGLSNTLSLNSWYVREATGGYRCRRDLSSSHSYKGCVCCPPLRPRSQAREVHSPLLCCHSIQVRIPLHSWLADTSYTGVVNIIWFLGVISFSEATAPS